MRQKATGEPSVYLLNILFPPAICWATASTSGKLDMAREYAPCRIVNQSFQRARNASEGQYTLSDVNIALTMAQMLRNGVPARLSSSNWCASPEETLGSTLRAKQPSAK